MDFTKSGLILDFPLGAKTLKKLLILKGFKLFKNQFKGLIYKLFYYTWIFVALVGITLISGGQCISIKLPFSVFIHACKKASVSISISESCGQRSRFHLNNWISGNDSIDISISGSNGGKDSLQCMLKLIFVWKIYIMLVAC